MEAAYTDAAGRTVVPANKNIDAGNINVETTFGPGVYQWKSDVVINSYIYLDGSDTDLWIFQTTGTFNVAAGVKFILKKCAKAENIVWQVAGTFTAKAGAHIEGIILGKTSVTFITGSTINGQIFAQANVALQQAVVTKP